MGALKLHTEQDYAGLKVVHGGLYESKKSVQRFLSVDPLTNDYPYYSPYQYAGNSPIELIDIDGSEGGKEVSVTDKIYKSINDFTDAVSDFLTFKSEREDIIAGVNNMAEGANKQALGPWNAWQIYNSENPDLAIAYRKTDCYIQGLTGVVQVSSGVQGISNKVQTVVEVPLILKDASQALLKKGTSNAVKGSVKPEASAPATSTYKMSDNVPEWKGNGNTNSPNFIVDKSGQAFPVPKGAKGPTPVINESGKQTGVAFTGGKGGKNGKVETMRIMDPTPPKGKSPGYPNGYIKYENAVSPTPQGVNPQSGQTTPKSQSHYPIKNKKD